MPEEEAWEKCYKTHLHFALRCQRYVVLPWSGLFNKESISLYFYQFCSPLVSVVFCLLTALQQCILRFSSVIVHTHHSAQKRFFHKLPGLWKNAPKLSVWWVLLLFFYKAIKFANHERKHKNYQVRITLPEITLCFISCWALFSQMSVWKGHLHAKISPQLTYCAHNKDRTAWCIL